MMSIQPSVGKPMMLSDSEDEDELFSDKVQDRLSASATDCCIVSEDDKRFPVHKAKLQEQSKVLRQVSMHVGRTLLLHHVQRPIVHPLFPMFHGDAKESQIITPHLCSIITGACCQMWHPSLRCCWTRRPTLCAY